MKDESIKIIERDNIIIKGELSPSLNYKFMEHGFNKRNRVLYDKIIIIIDNDKYTLSSCSSCDVMFFDKEIET